MGKEGATETYEKIIRLKMLAPDGKMRLTDCAATETMLAEATTTKLHQDRDTRGFERKFQGVDRQEPE